MRCRIFNGKSFEWVEVFDEVAGTPPTAAELKQAVEKRLREQPELQALPPEQQEAVLQALRKAVYIGEPIQVFKG
jgi:DNA-directed RNA polymerase specialized sigma24 family protein